MGLGSPTLCRNRTEKNKTEKRPHKMDKDSQSPLVGPVPQHRQRLLMCNTFQVILVIYPFAPARPVLGMIPPRRMRGRRESPRSLDRHHLSRSPRLTVNNHASPGSHTPRYSVIGEPLLQVLFSRAMRFASAHHILVCCCKKYLMSRPVRQQ